MHSFTLIQSSSPCTFCFFPKPCFPLMKTEFSSVNQNPTKSKANKPPNLTPITRIPSNSKVFAVSCLKINGPPVLQHFNVSDKAQILDVEFKSLSEPIDRVKRLLEYAERLPPFDECAKVQENRVIGCTAQVWLDVKMDNHGLMRFRVDSDSEIAKGFSSCLIWLLDGAEPDQVLTLKAEDLVELNMGLPSRVRSRVNTWHNVLINMQKRTKDLVEERDRTEKSCDAFSTLIC